MSDPSEEDQTDPSIELPGDLPTVEVSLDPTPEPAPLPAKRGRELPRGSQPPPAPPIRRGSVPPARMPKPSERPAAPRSRPPAPASERQRLAQMQTQLDQARSALAQQRNELDELRTRFEAKEARLEGMVADLTANGNVDERLRALDERGETLAEELRERLDADGDPERFERMDARVRELEDGTEMSRIRMRLERVGHTLREALAHLATLEETQRDLAKRVAVNEKHGDRIERLESLFEELAEEVSQEREADDLNDLRTRMDDFEGFVVRTGEGERSLREKLEKQTRHLAEIRENVGPPPTFDDLTKVKGIGPRFAKMLVQLGVSTYAAIADWDDDDIAAVAEKLKIKPARIAKAGWVASAKALTAS